jgi:hypothetical protein
VLLTVDPFHPIERETGGLPGVLGYLGDRRPPFN